MNVCDVCRSTDIRATVNMTITTGGSPALREASAVTGGNYVVWVLDGAPKFHDDGNCAPLVASAQSVGLAPELISFTQAEEDGFQPCSLCVQSNVKRSSWELCTGCAELFRAHDWQRIAAIIQSAIHAQLEILAP